MKNPVELRGDHAAIIIKMRDGTVVEVLVDTDDLPFLRRQGITWVAAWYEDVQNYRIDGHVPGSSVRGKGARKAYLHRLLLNAPKDLQVDHINHNTLDNRRSNLRLVTAFENQRNRRSVDQKSTTGVRGVHRHVSSGLYQVRFQRHHKTIHLGYFRELEAAAKVAREFLAKEQVASA